jgi:hypothetical protein
MSHTLCGPTQLVLSGVQASAGSTLTPLGTSGPPGAPLTVHTSRVAVVNAAVLLAAVRLRLQKRPSMRSHAPTAVQMAPARRPRLPNGLAAMAASNCAHCAKPLLSLCDLDSHTTLKRAPMSAALMPVESPATKPLATPRQSCVQDTRARVCQAPRQTSTPGTPL